MLKRKKILSKLLATTMVLTSFTVNASAAEVTTSTIGGNNRYETAIKISENGWSKSEHAVLINGEKGLVDALTATPYAYAKNSPILITKQAKLTPETGARLSAMGVKSVTVVGGTNSVSDAVVNEVKAKGISVERIYGASRYSTSLAVAKKLDTLYDVGKVAVVNGQKGIPDAVSVAAPAASNRMPIILADNKGIDAASKAFIDSEDITNSYVIGSLNSVSDATMNSLPGSKVRLGGADRHDTNAEVIKAFYTDTNLNRVYVAKSGRVKTDDEIVDALSAGVLAAKNGNPVVIVGNSLNASQQSLLASKKFNNLVQIGMGVPTNALNQIKATQADAEATATSVSVVNYKTITIKGSNLNLIDKSKVSIDGNAVDSYTANANGTEATVVFTNGFAASNAVKVTSNIGNVKELTFTYNTNISSVQASTKEIGKEGVQFLEFTVNGSEKRDINEIKSLGWKVEFKANQNVFYNEKDTSEDGKLITNFNDIGYNSFNYEVTLTKGNEVLKSAKGNVEIVDKAGQFRSIDSFDIARGDTIIKSNKIETGEVLNIINFKATNKDGSKREIATLLNEKSIDVKSSNTNVIRVQQDGSEKNKLTAVSSGTATITVTDGNINETVTLEVKDETRKINTVSSDNSLYIASSSESHDAIIVVKDQYGDPFVGNVDISAAAEVNNSTGTKEKIAGITLETESNDKGEVKLTIKPEGVDVVGSGTLALKTKDGTKTWKNITVNISKIDKSTSSRVEKVVKDADNTLDVYDIKDNKLEFVINEYNSNYFFRKVPKSDINKDNVVSGEGKYSLVLTDTSKAELQVADDGQVTLTAKKSGSVGIQVYLNGVKKETINISINDSTPTIKDISFKNIDTVKTANASFDAVSQVIDMTLYNSKNIVGGVTMTGKGGDVVYDASTGNLTVNSTPVGKVVVDTDFASGEVENNKVKLVEGAQGTITVSVYVKRGSLVSDFPINLSPITKNINVDIPKQ